MSFESSSSEGGSILFYTSASMKSMDPVGAMPLQDDELNTDMFQDDVTDCPQPTTQNSFKYVL